MRRRSARSCGGPVPPGTIPAMPTIERVELVVGLEVHVELSTRTKMFTRAPNLAHPAQYGAEPNTLIDPVVLGLPGALPVMNRAGVELSMMVGMALGCSVAERSVWDRKSYFYADLPKNYQISQYQLPLCFDGSVELPALGAGGGIDWEALATPGGGEDGATPGKRIGIIRAHLEEDAGKLLHEGPGGVAIGGTLCDWNRSGTPLLEIVTQPDFSSADEVVVFCQLLRDVCRFVGASEGVLQRGHVRFEPNINCALTLGDGRVVRTPIVEVKNLNSFKSVRGAIEWELREQPRRWLEDGREMGPGTKSTRGWDDGAQQTVLQREKEDAHDYRYFPDPDLAPVVVDEAWREAVRGRIPELPLARAKRFMREFGVSPKEAAALVDDRGVCGLYESAVEAGTDGGVERERAGKLAANLVLQSGAKRANERSSAERVVLVSELGITGAQIGALVALREKGLISANAGDELFGLLCENADGRRSEPAGADVLGVATRRGMIVVRDNAALESWCRAAIEAHPKVAEDVQSGKMQAIGRLVGAAVKNAQGAGAAADAKTVREKLCELLGVKEG